MKILYKFASRSRPEKFFKCLDNIYINSRHEDFLIMATLDLDDTSMFNEDVINKIKAYPEVYPTFGSSKNKIDAINRDLSLAPDFDIIINMSDDMLFVEEGFDLEIIKDFGNDLDQLLHYNDGNQKSNCMTMSIMGKAYFDRFGYIYHPSYISLWCDMEAKEAGELLGKHKYMGDEKILFKHFHPSFGLCQYDAQYRATENIEVWNKDEETYKIRKQNNFFLNV